MPVSSEYEWSFHYVLEILNDDLKSVFKRIGNLYNDVRKATELKDNDGNQEEILCYYKRFISKLHKIEYDKYIELCSAILTHVCDNKAYYGMNIYRFERQLRAFSITSDMKRLINCADSQEENLIILKSMALENIHFPKVYLNFSNSDSLEKTVHYAKEFLMLMDSTVFSCRLILDKLIENNWFDDWQNLFRITINELAAKVFYGSTEFDLSVVPNAQDNFEKLLSEPVRHMLIL